MKAGSLYSIVLVLAQFLVIILILSPVKMLWPPEGILWAVGAAFVVASLVLVFWAMATLGYRSLSVLPEPAEHAEFTQSGPYRHVRHPMYLALLLVGGGVSLYQMQAINWLYFSFLLIVLVLKIRREESLLASKYKQYDDYRRNSKALLPYIL